ncbi:MAG: 50S ribosomal protein L4 [Parcubacteria group bacterium GW2011_GWA2_51_10]|nr:MAG: 50S ribosomal protein L4 [Parcubacteria group bacterium GW2011_GWA2_51_10]
MYMATTSEKNKKIESASTSNKREVSNGVNADIYSKEGKKVGSLTLPENVFGVRWNDALMHQVVVSMQANARRNVAHTKNRGDVRGGGRKPWRQKGTGRARHGSIRSPIWKGGGVTHGPRNEEVFAKAIPQKMRAKALFVALSRKLSDGEILFVDSFGFAAPKTVEAKRAIMNLATVSGFEKLAMKKKNAALVAFADSSEAARKSFQNMGNVECMSVRNLNPLSVLGHTYLIIENPEAAIKTLESRASKNSKLKTQN